MIIPIKDKKKRVFGLLTIDTLREQNSVCPDMERTSLSGKQKPMIRLDEIQFYQVFIDQIKTEFLNNLSIRLVEVPIKKVDYIYWHS